MKPYETWLVGIISKRSPDALSVLGDLLRAGIKKGECSAADVRDRDFDEPRIIGAATRLLPNLGFVKNRARFVKMKDKKKHGREVPIWELKDYSRAEDALYKIRGVIMAQRTDEKGQMNLL